MSFPSAPTAPARTASGRLAAIIAVVAALALALGTVLATPLEAADEIFPYPVHQTTLDNGLRVVVVPFDSPGVLAYFTVVRTGSRDEVEEGKSGFAHFFEHMMFRGTERFSQDEYNDALKALGADSNAFTTDDYTNYYITGPAGALETMMDLESDRFQNLEYTEPVFRTEALAVLGEYNKNASNPFFPVYERARDLAFDRHTYSHTTMGFLEDIEAMPEGYEYSKTFFDRFYRPENCIVLLVGDVEPEAAFELAKRYYGEWEPGYEAPKVTAEPPQTEAREASIDWPSPIAPHLMMAWKTPAFDATSVDSAALDLLGQLLFAESAPLYQELVVDEQWVDFVGGGADARRDPYLFTVVSRVRSDDNVPKVRRAVLDALRGMQETPVDAERLERIKSHLRYSFALSLDSAPSVAFVVAEFLNLTGDPEAINRLYAQYQKVTPADIQRVARDLFREETRTTVLLAHSPQGDDAPGDSPADGADDSAEGR